MNWLLILLVTTSSAESFDSYREKNQPVKTECLNYRDRSHSEQSIAKDLQKKFSTFITNNTTAQTRKVSGIQHTNFDSKSNKVIFIFYRSSSGLGSQPGSLFRSDERQNINNLLTFWKTKENIKKEYTFIVRFNDECEVPPASKWK